MDGSCSRHIIKELNRAAWCVSLYDKGSDKCRATISGPVWDPLPQTPQASEHVAMAIAADLVTQEALPVSDCLGVVRLANSAPEQQLKATFKYAGIRRHAMSRPGFRFLMEAQHVSAHRSDAIIEALPIDERILAIANKAVDEGAKRSRLESHQWMHNDAEWEMNKEIQRCKVVCKVAAATLPLFPKMALKRVPRGHRHLQKRISTGWHDWQPFEGTWRCQQCLQAAPDGGSRWSLPISGCPGRPKAVCKLLATGETLGHRLQRCDTAGNSPLFFCVLCGSWAVNKCLNLLKKCEKQALRGSAGYDALARLARHEHPDYHGHKGEHVSTAMRHVVLESATTPAMSNFRTLAPRPGTPMADLYARVRAREAQRKEGQ